MSHEQMATEKKENKPQYFDVITKDEIESSKSLLKNELGIDLSNIKISIEHPGDDIFDRTEIQMKIQRKYNLNDDEYWDFINSKYNYNANEIDACQSQDIAKKEEIILEGKLPGFARTEDGNEINYFGIKEENIMEMAKNYALKEGDQDVKFANIGEAKNYLIKLGKKVFAHEAGHIVYKRLTESQKKEWSQIIRKYDNVVEKIIEIQKDKHLEFEIGLIKDEAFAEYFVNFASKNNLTGRLGKNEEAVEKIKEFIKEK